MLTSSPQSTAQTPWKIKRSVVFDFHSSLIRPSSAQGAGRCRHLRRGYQRERQLWGGGSEWAVSRLTGVPNNLHSQRRFALRPRVKIKANTLFPSAFTQEKTTSTICSLIRWRFISYITHMASKNVMTMKGKWKRQWKEDAAPVYVAGLRKTSWSRQNSRISCRGSSPDKLIIALQSSVNQIRTLSVVIIWNCWCWTQPPDLIIEAVWSSETSATGYFYTVPAPRSRFNFDNKSPWILEIS
jgi:hypothetical protein